MGEFGYRQKEIAVQLLGDVAILVVFACYWGLYRGAHNLVPAFLFVCWYWPTMYAVLKIHTTEETRTDERDREIEAEGFRDGFGVMSAGVFLLVWLHGGSSTVMGNELFLVWIVARIVIDGKKLRLYGGHRSWLPDSFGEWQRQRALRRLSHPTPRQREMAARYAEREEKRRERR